MGENHKDIVEEEDSSIDSKEILGNEIPKATKVGKKK